MPFKALNNREKEKAERYYVYQKTTKHLTLLTKGKRSQSALEYMMTYGWAILIIVIVAVILYSMGIFNPSSSVTFTSSGFSPFTVSSSLCNNLGYKIAVLAGPIPNNANSITINKVFLTSATGANTTTAGYTLTNPVTLKSGQSATILIPNVACTSAKVHYSFSAKIQYSYTASTLGLQTVNTTGTIAGTSISGKPSALTTYEPITITNTQSSATPNPFQQMVNFTSSDNGWTSISTGNFGQNVEFFYYNGTIIPSWLENYTSTNAIWWLKIAAIPGGSSETVYVGFAPTSTNLFNTVNDGEAPQLSPTYGEYFNAQNVFKDAWLFDTNHLPSGWVASGSYVINSSGLWLFPNSFVYYNIPQTSQGTLILYEADWLNTTSPVGGSQSFYKGFGNSAGAPLTGQLTWSPKMQSNTEFVFEYNGSVFSMPYDPYILRNQTEIVTISHINEKTYLTVNNNNPIVVTSSNMPNATSIYFNQQSETDTNGQIIYALYTPSTPPNDIMPPINFGGLQ